MTTSNICEVDLNQRTDVDAMPREGERELTWASSTDASVLSVVDTNTDIGFRLAVRKLIVIVQLPVVDNQHD